MEERFCELGLERLYSSELLIPGGALTKKAALSIGELVGSFRLIMDFLDDYVSKLIEGIRKGLWK
ncbi:MAG: hypothetical protein HUJ91_02815 [Bacteroidales bacterium]|nr:hypothetical protein [Bacteroidales bacterium]